MFRRDSALQSDPLDRQNGSMKKVHFLDLVPVLGLLEREKTGGTRGHDSWEKGHHFFGQLVLVVVFLFFLFLVFLMVKKRLDKGHLWR